MSLSWVTSERRQIVIPEARAFPNLHNPIVGIILVPLIARTSQLVTIRVDCSYFYPSFSYTNHLQYKLPLSHPVQPFFRYLLYNSYHKLMTVI